MMLGWIPRTKMWPIINAKIDQDRVLQKFGKSLHLDDLISRFPVGGICHASAEVHFLQWFYSKPCSAWDVKNAIACKKHQIVEWTKTCSLAKGFFHQHVFFYLSLKRTASLHGENRWKTIYRIVSWIDCPLKLAWGLSLLVSGIWQTWDAFRLLTYTLSHKMGSKGVIPSFRGMLPVAPYLRFFPAGKNRHAQTCLPLRSMESSEALAGKGKGLGCYLDHPM